MTTLYGISNCDTVKKARRWLEQQGIDYRFHDLRKDGLSDDLLQGWIAQIGWETLLNKRSTSWRQLSADQQQGLDRERACQLMRETPTLIRRPVLQHNDQLRVGFDNDDYQLLFAV